MTQITGHNAFKWRPRQQSVQAIIKAENEEKQKKPVEKRDLPGKDKADA